MLVEIAQVTIFSKQVQNRTFSIWRPLWEFIYVTGELLCYWNKVK